MLAGFAPRLRIGRGRIPPCSRALSEAGSPLGRARPAPPAMADKEETFEIVNERDEVVGAAPRSVAHLEGLLHRAVYCWIFDGAGSLLLQRRSAEKKIGASQWDLSVAEHLTPGETYAQGALRGVREELGLSALSSALLGPVISTHRRDLRQGRFHDAELVRSYALVATPDAAIAVDADEVAEVAWVPLRGLRARVEAAPEEHTEWLRAEGARLGWFEEMETLPGLGEALDAEGFKK